MASESHQPGINTILDKLEDAPDQPVPTHLRATDSVKTPNLYIFTSGTTGLPKAAVISQLQSLKGAAGLWAYGATADDIVYVTLPLYHSAASLLGVGGCIELGATFVLKKKFSASQFWSDCRKYNVTVFQYIGEICRYLCNMPKKEGEKDHKVRMGVGNGVQQNIWKEFLDRFGDIKLCELYGSTEGNICFMNHVGKIGAVGRSNFFYKNTYFSKCKRIIHTSYIQFPGNGLPNVLPHCRVFIILNKRFVMVVHYERRYIKYKLIDNFSVLYRTAPGEAGLLLSQINSMSPFFGYAGSKSLTEKKLLRDVFKKGDVYLNTGDLMVEDHEDFIYFKDRIGDTFRYRNKSIKLH
ncbi:UNVERIFIED_CONTAM: hypothetical protein FKN15_002489 [Acipenser sinensis]